jgi:hypothetical protein
MHTLFIAFSLLVQTCPGNPLAEELKSLANAYGLEALNLPAVAIEDQTKLIEAQSMAMAKPMHQIHSEESRYGHGLLFFSFSSHCVFGGELLRRAESRLSSTENQTGSLTR